MFPFGFYFRELLLQRCWECFTMLPNLPSCSAVGKSQLSCGKEHQQQVKTSSVKFFCRPFRYFSHMNSLTNQSTNPFERMTRTDTPRSSQSERAGTLQYQKWPVGKTVVPFTSPSTISKLLSFHASCWLK